MPRPSSLPQLERSPALRYPLHLNPQPACGAKRKVYIESRLGCAVDVAALLKL